MQSESQTTNSAENEDEHRDPSDENDSHFVQHRQTRDELINLANNNGALSYGTPPRLFGNETMNILIWQQFTPPKQGQKSTDVTAYHPNQST